MKNTTKTMSEYDRIAAMKDEILSYLEDDDYTKEAERLGKTFHYYIDLTKPNVQAFFKLLDDLRTEAIGREIDERYKELKETGEVV